MRSFQSSRALFLCKQSTERTLVLAIVPSSVFIFSSTIRKYLFEKNKMNSMLLQEGTSSSPSSIRKRVQEQDIASISKTTTAAVGLTTNDTVTCSLSTNLQSSLTAEVYHDNNKKKIQHQNHHQNHSSLTNTYSFIKTKSSPPKERQRSSRRQRQQEIDTTSLSPFDFHPTSTSGGNYISGSDHSSNSSNSSNSSSSNNNNNNNKNNRRNNNEDYKFVTTTSGFTNTSSVAYQPTESSIGPYDHRIPDPPSLLQSSLSLVSSSLPLPTAYALHRTGATVSLDSSNKNISTTTTTTSTTDQQLYSESITLKEEETNTMNNKYTKTAASSSSRPVSSQLQQQNERSDNESSYEPSQVDSESYLDFNEAAAQMYPQNYYYPSNNNNNNNNNNNTTNARGVGNTGDDTSINMTFNQQQQQQNYSTNQLQRNSTHSTIIPDATDIVHEMHLALLYLLSNPEEFSIALNTSPQFGATTLEQWNAEYDNESLVTAETECTGVINSNNNDNNNKKGILLQTSSTKGNTTTNNNTTKAGNDLSPAATKDSQSVITNAITTPLPYVVFADDAEVVLPQAHTASQLFGIERLEGIELEAAAGIPALCQLFLRWLALMPGGDHLNIIDPPGLTVMRIAGGRYRVTGAHRVVWTWMNEFAQLTFNSTSNSASVTTKSSFASNHTINNQNSNTGSIAALKSMSSPTLKTLSSGCVGSGAAGGTDIHTSLSSTNNRRKADGGDAVDQLQIGDLVSMTIVDVFETDSDGKLLSYCPTFDNRAIVKTNATTEVLRKSSTKVLAALNRAQKSKLALAVATHATTLATRLKKQVDKAVYGETTGSTTSSQDNGGYLYDTNVLSSPPRSNRQRHDSRDGDDYDVGKQQQQQQHFVQNLPSFSDNSSGIPTAAFDTQQQPHTSHVSSSRKTSKFSNNNKLDDTINTTTTTTSYIGDDDLERHEI